MIISYCKFQKHLAQIRKVRLSQCLTCYRFSVQTLHAQYWVPELIQISLPDSMICPYSGICNEHATLQALHDTLKPV